MSIRAYKFLTADQRSSNGGEPPWTVGETRSVKGRIKLCANGYHACRAWHHALRNLYIYGPVAAVVDLDGDCVEEKRGKIAARTCTALAMADVTRELRLFTCDCAERALTRERAHGREPDSRSWEAVTVAREYAEDPSPVVRDRLLVARSDAHKAWREKYDAAAIAALTTASQDVAAKESALEASKSAVYAANYAAAADATDAAVYAAADAAGYADRDWQDQRFDELMDNIFLGKLSAKE